MVEDKNLTEKVSKVSSSHYSSGFLSNCDNARKVQHLIKAAENSKERRPFQFGIHREDGDNSNKDDNDIVATQKSQAITVIGADQTNNHNNSFNANSTIDSRACYKPEKKVIIS